MSTDTTTGANSLRESGWADAHGKHVDISLLNNHPDYRNGFVQGLVATKWTAQKTS